MSGLEMKYFVLKPRGNDPYAKASREAMLTYHRLINKENPELSKELRAWATRELPDEELDNMSRALRSNEDKASR